MNINYLLSLAHNIRESWTAGISSQQMYLCCLPCSDQLPQNRKKPLYCIYDLLRLLFTRQLKLCNYPDHGKQATPSSCHVLGHDRRFSFHVQSCGQKCCGRQHKNFIEFLEENLQKKFCYALHNLFKYSQQPKYSLHNNKNLVRSAVDYLIC